METCNLNVLVSTIDTQFKLIFDYINHLDRRTEIMRVMRLTAKYFLELRYKNKHLFRIAILCKRQC